MAIASKFVLVLSVGAAILNLAFHGPKAEWAVPVMLAISASPALRPKWLTVILALSACATILIGQTAQKPDATKIAIVIAIICMALGFINRGLRSQLPNDRSSP